VTGASMPCAENKKTSRAHQARARGSAERPPSAWSFSSSATPLSGHVDRPRRDACDTYRGTDEPGCRNIAPTANATVDHASRLRMTCPALRRLRLRLAAKRPKIWPKPSRAALCCDVLKIPDQPRLWFARFVVASNVQRTNVSPHADRHHGETGEDLAEVRAVRRHCVKAQADRAQAQADRSCGADSRSG